MPVDNKATSKLRREYPNFTPLKPRQLSKLVAEGREPFCLLGANIGTRQRYIRIYTERLIAYLNGNSLED